MPRLWYAPGHYDRGDRGCHARPTTGDYSVCMKCGALLQFTDTLSYRALSDEEFATFPQDKQDALRLAQHVAAQIRNLKARRSGLQDKAPLPARPWGQKTGRRYQ